MSSHVIWQRRYVSETDTFELVAPLFVGSESECIECAPAIYNLICSWSVNDWREVCVDVLDNAGEAFVSGGIVAVGDFAWFKSNLGAIVWGEVDQIAQPGERVYGSVVCNASVIMEYGYTLTDFDGSGFNEPQGGTWGADLARCFGVGREVK